MSSEELTEWGIVDTIYNEEMEAARKNR